MLRARSLLFVPLALMFASSQADASIIFYANLSGSQETTPNNSTATGIAWFELNDAMTALTMNVTVDGIDFTGTQTATTADNLGAAHIHALAPGAPLNATGGVVWGFIGNPFNNTMPNDGVVTPYNDGRVGGTVSAVWNAPEGNAGTNLTLQLPNLLAGRTYINFHTTAFPGGEIRGAIVATPEPASLTLLGLGLVGLGRSVWKRRRS